MKQKIKKGDKFMKNFACFILVLFLTNFIIAWENTANCVPNSQNCKDKNGDPAFKNYKRYDQSFIGGHDTLTCEAAQLKVNVHQGDKKWVCGMRYAACVGICLFAKILL